MKKYTVIIILALSMIGLASCNCKTCKKDSEISVTVCQDGGSQDEYENWVQFYESLNYTCR